jgi:hypothetical protein
VSSSRGLSIGDTARTGYMASARKVRSRAGFAEPASHPYCLQKLMSLHATLCISGRNLEKGLVSVRGRTPEEIVAQYRGRVSLSNRDHYRALAALSPMGYLPPSEVNAYVGPEGDTTVLLLLIQYLDSFPSDMPVPELHVRLWMPAEAIVPLVPPRQRSARNVILLLKRAAAGGASSITVESSPFGTSLTPSMSREPLSTTAWTRTSSLALLGKECLLGGELWGWAKMALGQASVRELTVDTCDAGTSHSDLVPGCMS